MNKVMELWSNGRSKKERAKYHAVYDQVKDLEPEAMKAIAEKLGKSWNYYEMEWQGQLALELYKAKIESLVK